MVHAKYYIEGRGYLPGHRCPTLGRLELAYSTLIVTKERRIFESEHHNNKLHPEINGLKTSELPLPINCIAKAFAKSPWPERSMQPHPTSVVKVLGLIGG